MPTPPRARSAMSTPADVIAVVDAEMLRALRVVSVERGHDPRDFALVAYGGAGPLHACSLADELGIETVLVPSAAGVLSALGLVASDERRDEVTSYVCPLRDAGELPGEGEAELRYQGQSFELTVPLGPDLDAKVPCGPRRALRRRVPRARDRARRRADSARFARGRMCRCRLASRSRPTARRWSSSTAPPVGFPPGGWGLGMGPHCV